MKEENDFDLVASQPLSLGKYCEIFILDFKNIFIIHIKIKQLALNVEPHGRAARDFRI